MIMDWHHYKDDKHKTVYHLLNKKTQKYFHRLNRGNLEWGDFYHSKSYNSKKKFEKIITHYNLKNCEIEGWCFKVY